METPLKLQINLSRKLSITNIKLGQLAQERLDVVLAKIKNRKSASLDEIPSEVLKTRKFSDLLLRCTLPEHKREMNKRQYPTFHKKGDLGITKNYQSITLTSIGAKIYNTLQLNRIKPEIEKIL